MLAARRIAGALDRVYRPRKVGMLAAGFDVDHVHIHVLPMFDYHDITSKAILDGTRSRPTEDELGHEAERVRREFSTPQSP